jgi:hypothetical protein
VLSAGMQKPQPNRIFNDWNVYKFSQNIANLPTKYLSQYRGAYYCIWSDYYTRETQDVIYQGTFKSIATFAEKTWNVFSKLDYNQNLKNIINIGTDIENSNSISPFLTSKDDHIFGPNVIDTASVEYSDGNNSEYFMDDVNWNASTKNINWTILNPDPKFRDLLYIDTNATIGTTRGTCLVRYPDWSQLPEGNYVFTLQAEVTSDSGDKVLYMKQITVVY